MLCLNYHASVPRSLCSQSMQDPVSPVYTSYSPFSSGSSASYPARSPVSEPFDSIADLDHHRPAAMDDYTLGYPSPSASLPGYADLSYPQSQEFDVSMMNWSAPEASATATKRSASAFQHSQQFQQPIYRAAPSRELPSEVERLKNLALYIPPTSPAFHQQRQQSPTIIHSPVPIPVPSNASPHSPSLVSHSPHPLQQSHRAQHHLQDPYFQVDTDKWRTNSQYTPAYTHHTHSHSHSGIMTQGYSSLHGDLSHSSSMRRAVSEYPPHESNGSLRVKQEDMEIYSSLGPYGGHRQRHIFDLSASPPRNSVPNHSHLSHISQGPAAFYSHTHSEQLQQQHHHHQHPFVVHPADLTPPEHPVNHPGFEASPVDIGYSADTGYEQGVFSSDSGYVDVCDPQFVGGIIEKTEPVDSGQDSEADDERTTRDGGFETHYVGGAAGAANAQEARAIRQTHTDVDADVDADGEDDIETRFSPASYVAPPPHQSHQHGHTVPQRGDGHSQRKEPHGWVEADPAEDDFEDEDEEDLESEDDDDDMRDPEFVLRRKGRNRTSSVSSSFPLEGRNLRSGRFNPYPSSSSYSASPTDGGPSGEFVVSQQEQFSSPSSSSQPLRSRRAYSHTHAHTSVSPSTSEPYSPVSVTSTGAPRRRARPTTSLPIPIPVPNLTKKSRGRRVPTMEDFKDELDLPVPAPIKGKKKGANAVAKIMRTYTCDVDGCGKLFARGEHLKRHIRSIHTYEKPHRCPYPGCGKDFSRHDNLGQHMRVHKDYVAPKESQKG
ncbi:hypothetical protein H2248_001521 [Termitomyces sp. 'cryptogamus']|nr:hypothetical protein H2248_001521 [Termitomyces sp. 'cryptogamus']